MILFFTNKINPEHNKVLAAMTKFLDHETRCLNIPQHRPDDHVKEHAIIVSFGKLAATLVDQSIQEKRLAHVHHTRLAHPEFLFPLHKNQAQRLFASAELEKVKEIVTEQRFYPDAVIVSEKDLPELSAIQLLLLKKMTDEEGKKSCFQTTKGGKIIEISNEPLENSNADVHLTFNEVFTVRSIMDVLGVSQVDLVSITENNSD